VRLSVCCVTNDPGPQVAAALEPLRPLADEIVIAADAAAGLDALRHYATVADRLLRIEVPHAERSLAWLHAQCSSDWILRVDGDEVPSAALIRVLPELMQAGDVEQYWLPRRWLFPDEDSWLDGHPWWPDYQNRLVRNGPQLRFTGALHTSAEPVLPARYVTAPLYHLDTLVSDIEKRRAKAYRYEAAGLRGYTAFYLPELHNTCRPAAVPEEDRQAVRRALRGQGPPPAGKAPTVELTPLAAADAYLPGRPVAGGAYEAAIEPLEREHPFRAGESRAVHFEVENRGTETWGWNPEFAPAITASYRWLRPTGARVTHDGQRTPFPATVPPGESVVVPLIVTAPEAVGDYVLEVDLVHEHVRWFDCPAHVQVRVAPEDDLAARRRSHPAASVVERPIPKLVHRVWLGGAPMPEKVIRCGESWRRHNPAWKQRLWTDRRLPRGVDRAALARCANPAERSDVIRYHLMSRYGGIYVDTDFECLRPIDPLIENLSAFAGYEEPGRVGSGIVGSAPGQPAFRRLAEEVAKSAGRGIQPDATGPPLITRVLREHPEVMVFPAEVFYPYHWTELHLADGPFPQAYAVHHWTLSWSDAAKT
jgi:hypothetical protein